MRRDERGAVAILTAASMLLVMTAVAMAVDVGDVVWRKRQLQRTVDLASLDAVRALGDRRDATQTRCAQAGSYAQQSALRNNFGYANPGNSLSIELGTVDRATKTFTSLTDCSSVLDPPNATAVRVTGTTSVPFKFLPGTDGLSAQAVAGVPAQSGGCVGACSTNNCPSPCDTSPVDARAEITIGTKLSRFDSSKSPLLDSLFGCLAKGGGTC
jgi:uncharacterized membrane protein